MSCNDQGVNKLSPHTYQHHQNQFESETSYSRPRNSSRIIQENSIAQSIDEFLAHYRPTKRAIRALIDCLNDPQFPASNIGSNRSYESGYDSSDSCPEPVEALVLTQNKTDEIPESLDPERSESVSGRRSRSKYSLQEREERRRDQNREAQRRFRDRQMFATSRDTPGDSMT